MGFSKVLYGCIELNQEMIMRSVSVNDVSLVLSVHVYFQVLKICVFILNLVTFV